MNAFDYLLKLALFWVFFALWATPLVFIAAAIPGHSGLGGLIGRLTVIVLLAWVLAMAPWLAHMAARQSTYEYASPVQSVAWAVNRVRFYLAFLPIIGPSLAPPTPPNRDAIEPE